MKSVFRKIGVCILVLSMTSVAQADELSEYEQAFQGAAGQVREVVHYCQRNPTPSPETQALAQEVVVQIETLTAQVAESNLAPKDLDNLSALAEQMFSALDKQSDTCLAA
jgi:hypothetical protein